MSRTRRSTVTWRLLSAQAAEAVTSRANTRSPNRLIPSIVVGVISIGDVVKDIIRDLEHNVGDLMGYIMKDGPGG